MEWIDVDDDDVTDALLSQDGEVLTSAHLCVDPVVGHIRNGKGVSRNFVAYLQLSVGGRRGVSNVSEAPILAVVGTNLLCSRVSRTCGRQMPCTVDEQTNNDAELDLKKCVGQ